MAPKMEFMKISMDPTKETQKIFDMIKKEWRKRFENVTEQVVYEAGKRTFEEVTARIPSKPEYSLYKNSLELATVRGMKKRSYAVSINSRRYTRKIRLIDAADTILYIRARRGMSRIDSRVSILEEHSPWTLNTIPFMPSKRAAVTVSRRVSKREVEKVERLRKRDARIWKYALSRLNVRVSSNKKKLPVIKKGVAVPDKMFEALRMEFGLSGKATPHWRPGILSFIRSGVKDLKKNKKIIRAVMDPSFSEWKKWPTKTKRSVSMNQAEGSREFVKRLGIKAVIR